MSSDIEDPEEMSQIPEMSQMDTQAIKTDLQSLLLELESIKNGIKHSIESSVVASLDLEESGGQKKQSVDLEKINRGFADQEEYAEILKNSVATLLRGDLAEEKTMKTYIAKLKKAEQNYEKKKDSQKYGSKNWYKDYRTQLWEISHMEEPMPPLFEDDDNENDDIIISSSTVGFKCPLSTNYLENPMTSKLCNHSYSKAVVLEYLKKGRKQCPVTGCLHSITMGDLYENKILEGRIRRYLRIRREKELTQQRY
ncbi:hypothetical protein BB559_001628 [Furculomyces boomerangus]|uniref:SP-RING-type domain-containing protein n=1 Tax=Furculomyces boomerangus TaxID=61424 RepID=A0A2T9Z1H1_9FUNG|nr:hypothetical protein BB559_001628 [Furculomyces boomerangus]